MECNIAIAEQSELGEFEPNLASPFSDKMRKYLEFSLNQFKASSGNDLSLDSC